MESIIDQPMQATDDEQASPSPRTVPQQTLTTMLELLRDQEEQRRVAAASLATSLLRACANVAEDGENDKRAWERAQATVRQALRKARANSGNRNKTWQMELPLHMLTPFGAGTCTLPNRFRISAGILSMTGVRRYSGHHCLSVTRQPEALMQGGTTRKSTH